MCRRYGTLGLGLPNLKWPKRNTGLAILKRERKYAGLSPGDRVKTQRKARPLKRAATRIAITSGRLPVEEQEEGTEWR